MEKCDWPESTQGVLGNQAMACINSLEVQVVEDIPEDEIIGEEIIKQLPEENQEVVAEPEVIESPVVEEATPEPEPVAPIIEEVEPVVEPEPVEPVVEPTPELVELEINTAEIKRVSDLYIFTETLQAGNTGNGVSNLKDILSVLGYYR